MLSRPPTERLRSNIRVVVLSQRSHYRSFSRTWIIESVIKNKFDVKKQNSNYGSNNKPLTITAGTWKRENQ